MIKEIVKDNKGVEYYLIKANRVNWDVERISDGARLRGNASIFTFDRTVQVEAPVIDPLVRIGAIVKVRTTAGIRSNAKFAREQDKKFVIIGFDGYESFKCIEVGGNNRNAFWKIAKKDLELT